MAAPITPAVTTSPVAVQPAAPQLAAQPTPVAPVAPAPIVVAPPKTEPGSPVALAAPVGGIAGILGGAASAIGWFMPWFGLGQIGQGIGALGGLLGLGGLGGGSGLGSLLGGGVGGSGFQLLMLAFQVPGLLNSFGGLYGGFGARPDTGGILLIAILAILVLILIPIMGLLNIRAGASALQLRSDRDSIGVNLVRNQLNALTTNSTIGFILMVIIFILLAQIPFATMLLSSGFFITAGGFALAWFGALLAKGQIRPGPYRTEGDGERTV
jgi:hypothetical protein